MPSRRRKIPPPASTPRTPSLPTSPPAEALSPLSPISPWPPLPPLERPVPSNTTCTSSPDDLPTSREIYGSLTVLLTYLAFATYLAWSILPGEWLERIGWSWYPAQEWAVVVPSWMMVLVLLAYWSYAGITAYLTPGFDSVSLITDKHSGIPSLDGRADDAERYYSKFADQGLVPEGVDLPLDLVNRLLYPPRKRLQG